MNSGSYTTREEGFWTIVFRRIINKRDRRKPWITVFVKEEGENCKATLSEIPLSRLKDPDSVAFKYYDYNVACSELEFVRNFSAKKRKYMIGNGEVIYIEKIYVKNNTERKSPILYGTGEDRI